MAGGMPDAATASDGAAVTAVTNAAAAVKASRSLDRMIPPLRSDLPPVPDLLPPPFRMCRSLSAPFLREDVCRCQAFLLRAELTATPGSTAVSHRLLPGRTATSEQTPSKHGHGRCRTVPGKHSFVGVDGERPGGGAIVVSPGRYYSPGLLHWVLLFPA